jgi:hypothetical protein
VKRGVKRVRLCDQIIELAGGERYVCGRHTKNRTGQCSQHNRPATRPQTVVLQEGQHVSS